MNENNNINFAEQFVILSSKSFRHHNFFIDYIK